jgi:hypothetical protein
MIIPGSKLRYGTAKTRRGHVRWTVSLVGVGPAEHRDNLAGVNLLGAGGEDGWIRIVVACMNLDCIA